MINEPPVIVRTQDLGNVALKFTGLWVIFLGIMSAPALFHFASLPERSTRKGLEEAIYGVAYLVLGAYLTKWSAKLSEKLFGPSATIVTVPLPIAAELQTVAFRVVGLCVLVGSLPLLVQSLIESTNEDLRSGALSFVGFVGTQVVLGILLLLYRSVWILRMWKKLRSSSGRPTSSPT